MQTITIERIDTGAVPASYWRVTVGDEYAEVAWCELLALVASLTMPEGRRPGLIWLRSAAEHNAEHERLMLSSKANAAEFITAERENIEQ